MGQKESIKILVIDDEPDVVEIIAMNLKSKGFEILKAYDGSLGLETVKEKMPDLIILDLMLPKMSGFEICDALKKEVSTARIPIIMLTAKAEVDDRIEGLEYGADDYIVKPFSPRELLLRIESVLKRTRTGGGPARVLAVGNLTLNENHHEAKVDDKVLILTATEFKLLALLMERKEEVQDRSKLLNDVWGYSSMMDTRTVDTHVRRLREKLGEGAKYIETIRGVGYRATETPSLVAEEEV